MYSVNFLFLFSRPQTPYMVQFLCISGNAIYVLQTEKTLISSICCIKIKRNTELQKKHNWYINWFQKVNEKAIKYGVNYKYVQIDLLHFARFSGDWRKLSKLFFAFTVYLDRVLAVTTHISLKLIILIGKKRL